MKKLIFGLLIFLLALCITFSDVEGQTLSPSLAPLIENSPDSSLTVVIFIDNVEQQNKTASVAHRIDLDKTQKINKIVTELKSASYNNQSAIEKYLTQNSQSKIKKNWITPAYTATLTMDQISELSSFNGIKFIIENVALEYESPIEITAAPELVTEAVSNQLSQLNIPVLWQRGLKGKGRLICSFDTGVEQSHPALADKWRGNTASLSESWFSKVKPDSLPFDATGHGTHTMGIMVGAVPSDSIGVAPEAEWITAGVIDQGRSLSVTISDILDAFEWVLNPDGDLNTSDDVPDVVLNSWGIPKGLFLPCDDTFWDVIDNVEAAGIVTIFAAGNEGPNPMSLRSPADRASSPLNAFAVGAIDDVNNVATFSSRGPSSCDTTKVKPEVVAPGVLVRSSTRGGSYSYMSGTSMAAPYIAGIVALMREYNPNATVSQIKTALLLSATDLGEQGEDNSYGHGLVDASKVLDFLPLPNAPEFEIIGSTILNNEAALPGETIDYQISLMNPIGNVLSVEGILTSLDQTKATVINDSVSFYFGLNGTIAMNMTALKIELNENLYHSENIPLMLELKNESLNVTDTIFIDLTAGYTPPGIISNESSTDLELSISDFGQFGFAPNSIYNVNGRGLRFNNSDNLLYESSVLIGRNSLQLATSFRNQDGTFKPSDFVPTHSLSEALINSGTNYMKTATFNDKNSMVTIPVDVEQEVYFYNETENDNFVIIKYRIINNSIENITDLSFGFTADFDFNTAEQTYYNEELKTVYQSNGNSFIGIAGLINVSGVKAIASDNKNGRSNTELYSLISDSLLSIESSTSDNILMLTSGKFHLSPGQSKELYVAFVAGTSESNYLQNLVRARAKVDVATDVEDNDIVLLPDDFKLYQNYPNPFNPSTTIAFDLPKSSNVNLVIYNINGQKVKTLHSGELSAGNYQFEWDATNSDGQKAASGIYFYKVSTDYAVQSHKMILMK